MKTKTQNFLIDNFDIFVKEDAGKHRTHFDPQSGVFVYGSLTDHTFFDVISNVRMNKLSGEDLNKTFYKSWNSVLSKTREELLVDQITHYLTTYTNIIPGYVYIPDEELNVPSEKINVPVRVLVGVTGQQAIDQVERFLNSGLALSTELVEGCVDVLIDLGFKGDLDFRNVEANIIAADRMGTVPIKAEHFLRFVLYKATGSSLLIKNYKTIESVKMHPAPAQLLLSYAKAHGEAQLAPVFNRFKPLFLAMKNGKTKKIINRISKLSKKAHVPLPHNPLNSVATTPIEDHNRHWLKNATVFALLRALDYLKLVEANPEHFAYRIRNGKMWVCNKSRVWNGNIIQSNRVELMNELRSRVDGTGKTIYIPENVDYAVPTSEKSFIGAVPINTKIKGKSLNVGMYWKNSWGARDLDLHATNISGEHVGWNSAYRGSSSNVVYSGDITSASDGAVEYMRCTNGCGVQLIGLNVYSGDAESEYNIIVGETPDQVDQKYMQDPNNLYASIRTKTENHSSVLGIVSEEDDKVVFTFAKYSNGQGRVSRHDEKSVWSIQALKNRSLNRLSLVDVLTDLGYTVVHDMNGDVIDHHLGLDNISKDSIMTLFK